jgi:predicted nucleotidyltransferase
MPVSSVRTNSLALGDVDRDGDLDLVVGIGAQSRLYLNDGTGTFADATASRLPIGIYSTRSLALGDVDRDGDLDLVLGNDNQQSRLYLNNGTGTFTDATASRMPVGIYDTHSLALGDVDGDGDLDLVLGNSGQQSRLYLSDGSGTFTDATASRLPVGIHVRYSSLAFGDVDGDSDLDLVVGGNYGQQSRLYLNDGKGQFTDATASRLPIGIYSTRSLALGDVDRDGDLDLALGNRGQQSRLYLNDGTGTFTDATASRLPVGIYTTTSLALGDVDRDGDLDLVLGNWGGNVGGGQNRLYLNLRRQLDAPYVLHVGRNYQLDVYSRYGPATTTELAFPFLSTGTANIPLPPRGTIGIDVSRMIALPPFLVPQPAGIGSLTIPIPNLPALAGLAFYTQVLLDQQPVQARLTNVVRDIMLR